MNDNLQTLDLHTTDDWSKVIRYAEITSPRMVPASGAMVRMPRAWYSGDVGAELTTALQRDALRGLALADLAYPEVCVLDPDMWEPANSFSSRIERFAQRMHAARSCLAQVPPTSAIMLHALGPPEGSFPSVFEAIVQRLGRLADGWAGAGSSAPTSGVMRDLAKLSVPLQCVRVEPNVEVDPDGAVSLIWDAEDASFSLTVTGNGRLVGTLSPYALGAEPWVADVGDERSITDRLEEAIFARFISSDAVQ